MGLNVQEGKKAELSDLIELFISLNKDYGNVPIRIGYGVIDRGDLDLFVRYSELYKQIVIGPDCDLCRQVY